MKKFIDEAWLVMGIIIGFWGGITRAIKCKPDDFTWFGLFFRVSSAAFVSILVGLIMLHTDYPPTVEAAIIGASGYAAVDILRCVPDVIRRRARKL